MRERPTTETLALAASYVPRTLLEVLRDHPARRSPWIDAVDGTLVMADVSGFTAMSERLADAGKEGAEVLTDIISGFFGRILGLAWDQGGITMSFGGDAILLLFTGDGHARRAVAASLAMLRETERTHAYTVGGGRIKLGMSMGAHAGTYHLAAVGIEELRMQYLVLGPDTTRTAEAESAADSGQLMISPETARVLGATATSRKMDEFHLVDEMDEPDEPNAGTFAESGGVLPDAVVVRLIPYVPPSLGEALFAGSSAREIQPEHRKVAVVFLNIMGTDELLTAGGTQALLSDVSRYTETVVRLTGQYEGFVMSNDIHANGFKLIVTFGAPVAHEEDTANALRFACDLREAIAGLDLRLTHRIGVNGGFVFAGDMGPEYRRQYTVMGDAVNLAARLMSAAGPGQIMTTRQTADEVGSSCVTRDLPPIRVKGKSEPISVCTLEEKRTATSAERVSTQTPLLGRSEELATFQAIIGEARTGAGRSILLVGEAGLGKSRLMLAYEELLGREDWMLIEGPCYAHTRFKPFAPWIGLLKGLFGIEHQDDADQRVEKVWNAAACANPGLVAFVSLLTPLLGLGLAHSPEVLALDDNLRRQRLFDLVASVVRHAASTRPLALVVEDLHWSDRSSRDLLQYVARRSGHVPLLVLCSTRPEGEFLIQFPEESTEKVLLRELPAEAALSIMRATLRRDTIAEHVVEAVLTRARGNPLFLEEIARSLRRGNILERLEASLPSRVAVEMEVLDVADRVQGLLMARIDSLEADAKNLLRVASVVGWTFDADIVSDVVADTLDVEQIEANLRRLLDEAFIEEHSDDGGGTYHFRHALVQDVAYESLPYARRRDLHRRVGERIETRYSDTIDRHFEELVHHYTRSEDNDKTRLYSVKAAEKARSVFAHSEAIDYLERARNSVKARNPEAACLRSGLIEAAGDSYEMSGCHIEAVSLYRDALTRWRRLDASRRTNPSLIDGLDVNVSPDVRESVLSHKIATAFERSHSHYDQAFHWLSAALESLPEGHPSHHARILATQGYLDVRLGRYGEAVQAAQEAVELSIRAQDTRQQAVATNVLGGAFRESGQLREAITHHLTAIGLFEEMGDIHGQAAAHGNLANCYEMCGELDLSLEHNEIALALYEKTGYATGMQISRHNIGDVLVTQGKPQEAIEHFAEVVREYNETGSGAAVAGLALVNLARAEQAFEHYERADEHLQRGVEILTDIGAEGLLYEARYQLAELRLEQGRFADACELATDALDDAERQGQQVLAAKFLRVRGRSAMGMGDLKDAERDLHESRALADRIDAEHESGLALLALAELYRTRDGDGARQSCEEALAQAIDVFERAGAVGDLARALKLGQGLTRRGPGTS